MEIANIDDDLEDTNDYRCWMDDNHHVFVEQ